MIRIDDSLLEELGLINLPKAERDALLRQIYETLEMRVGMKLAERMSDQQLDEFERFIDGDMTFTEGYLNTTKPDWQTSDTYKTAVTTAQATAQKRNVAFNENSVKSEFGALTWLETNFPDYKQVVASELDTLKGEVKADSAKIMQAASQDSAAPLSQPGQNTTFQPQSQPQAQPTQQPYTPPAYQQPQPMAPAPDYASQEPPQAPVAPQSFEQPSTPTEPDQGQQPPLAA